MLILELAVQAVRGFSPSARIALRPGYVGLQSPGELPAPLSGLLVALCFPDGRGGDGAFLAPGAKTGKAGLSIQGSDQLVYRLVRELGGQGALHKLNRATNQFEVVTQDSAEMVQVLRGAVGFPQRSTFEQLFTFSVGQLPTRRPRPKKKAPAAEKAAGPRLASSFDAPVQAAGDVAAARAQLAKLEAEVVVANEVGDLQFKIDGLGAELFKLEARTKDYLEMKARVAEAQQKLEGLPTPEKLQVPPETFARMRGFDEEKKKFREAMQRLEAEKESAQSAEVYVPDPVIRDPRFLGSLAAGLACVAGGVFLEGTARYLALLGVPAFTFAALLALRYIEELQRAGKQGATAGVFAGREKKLTDEFAALEATVDKAIASVGANSIEDFFSILRQAESLRPEVEQLEAQLGRFESDPEFRAIPRRIAEIKQQQEAGNDRLLAVSGGFMRDPREIEREIARLKESLALAEAPQQAAAPVSGLHAIATGPGETFEDPMPALLRLAADLFATDVPTLWTALQPRAVQYLQALSDRRYHGLDVDLDGNATVHAPGRSLALGELPGRDLDLVFLAVRLTVVEKFSGQGKIPVIFEDAFAAALDPAKQPLLARMLKHLGTLTQVLHVTPAGQNAAAADAQVAL